MNSYFADIRENRPVSLVRPGATVWRLLSGDREELRKGDRHSHESINRLVADLSDAIADNAIDVCVSDDVFDAYAPVVNAYRLNRAGISTGDPLRGSSWDEIAAFFGDLSQARPIVVGRPELRTLKPLLRYREFVDIPPRDPWRLRNELLYRVAALLESTKRRRIVLVCDETLGVAMVGGLRKRFDARHSYLDCCGFLNAFCRRRPSPQP